MRGRITGTMMSVMIAAVLAGCAVFPPAGDCITGRETGEEIKRSLPRDESAAVKKVVEESVENVREDLDVLAKDGLILEPAPEDYIRELDARLPEAVGRGTAEKLRELVISSGRDAGVFDWEQYMKCLAGGLERD